MRTGAGRRQRRRHQGAAALTASVAACAVLVGVAVAAATGGFNPFAHQRVGQKYAAGILLPTNQWIAPLGRRTLVDNGRLVSSALSPNGEYVAAATWRYFGAALTIIDVKTGKIVQQVGTGTGAIPTLGGGGVAADGPLYTPDGTTLYVPQSSDIVKLSVDPATGIVSDPVTISLPNGPHGDPLPSGLALSSDGSKLYVALNADNTMGVIDTATDELVQQIPVGNAPRQVVLTDGGATAYVSNEGGRPAAPGQFTNLSDGTPIVSSKVTGAAITGTVSVVDLTTGKETKEISVGLQPTALYQSGDALFVANSNDDSMSVIDERTDAVAQTVDTNPVPGATIGSYANAISMPDATHVLVSIGRDNAIAVFSYAGMSKPLKLLGLLPTDWYPVEVAPDPALARHGRDLIVVTNDKGIGDRGPRSTINEGPDTKSATGYNTYDDTGSVTTFTMPSAGQITADSRTVGTDNAWNEIKPIDQGAYDSVPSVIPRHLGGPSPIKHIVVIVKENRTYDQVLGDLGEGNGDASLAQFGKRVTPNLHALARRFGDLDNFYDEGTLSADGHNWIVQAEANDYVEKAFGELFFRTYPAQGGDALAYQRDGFLWNAAERAGLSVQDFGEYAYDPESLPAGAPDWDAWYKDALILQGKAKGSLPAPTHKYRTSSDIPSLTKIIDPWYPDFNLGIPDQYRVDMWLQVFDQQKKTARLPALTFMWVPDDHTAGVGSGDPDPVAEAADNDLAVGRIVDQISHSRFWKSTAIFVLEDDSQNGVDHVDGHRSPVWVVSPYSKPGVDDQYYSQINMVRTIEQILGIHPMNQEDGGAEPMYAAFTSHPDLAPYSSAANEIPLTLGAPGYPSTFKAAGDLSGIVPADMRAAYDAWVAWSRRQPFNGSLARVDAEKPVMLNRLDWYSAHDWKVAYPGDPKIYLPDQVPGRNLPAAFLGDS